MTVSSLQSLFVNYCRYRYLCIIGIIRSRANRWDHKKKPPLHYIIHAYSRITRPSKLYILRGYLCPCVRLSSTTAIRRHHHILLEHSRTCTTSIGRRGFSNWRVSLRYIYISYRPRRPLCICIYNIITLSTLYTHTHAYIHTYIIKCI